MCTRGLQCINLAQVIYLKNKRAGTEYNNNHQKQNKTIRSASPLLFQFLNVVLAMTMKSSMFSQKNIFFIIQAKKLTPPALAKKWLNIPNCFIHTSEDIHSTFLQKPFCYLTAARQLFKTFKLSLFTSFHFPELPQMPHSP